MPQPQPITINNTPNLPAELQRLSDELMALHLETRAAPQTPKAQGPLLRRAIRLAERLSTVAESLDETESPG